MGFFDKLFGNSQPQPQNNASYIGTQPFNQTKQPGAQPTPQQLSDQQALARYRYMLQTAPPEALEQAHAEAFAQLTPEQRQMVLQQIAQNTPDNERAQLNDDPRSLARAATRAEMRQPGMMERTFNGMGGGAMGGGMMGGMGGMLAGSLLTSIAGGFVGSSIANSFFNHSAVAQDYAQSDLAQQSGDTDFNDNGGMSGTDYDSSGPGLTSDNDPYGDPGASVDPYGDPGAGDNSGGFGDVGGDAGGDFGGDFGGGDFGGGGFGDDFGGDF